MKKITAITILIASLTFVAFQAFNPDPAVRFLNALNEEQRGKAQMAFDDSSKDSWHFFQEPCFPGKGSSYLN